MSKVEKTEKIKKAVENALLKYDAENVDIVRQEETNVINIMYHSRHNSFPIVSNVCTANGLSETDIDKISREYDTGYCW